MKNEACKNLIDGSSFYNNVALLPLKEKLKPLWDEHAQLICDPRWVKYQQSFLDSPILMNTKVNLNSKAVTISGSISEAEREKIFAALETFKPWKKGPFSLFNIDIDSEWRSDLKWDRIISYVGSLKEQKICDVGCHNGYYMFRALAHDPKFVIGLEPVAKHWYNFHLLNKYISDRRLRFELLGIEHIDLFAQVFDTVFCLGILYHHTDPVSMLKKIFRSLRPGGQVIIDCQGIPGEGSLALIPEKRYANASGIWFLPQEKAIENWLKRTGFRDIHCFYKEKLSPDEQRRTLWADIESLAEFLDPLDPDKTIEGYPAPWRFYFRAVR